MGIQLTEAGGVTHSTPGEGWRELSPPQLGPYCFSLPDWDVPLPFKLPWELAPPGGHTRKCLSPPAPVEGAVTALILHSNTPAARLPSNLCEHWGLCTEMDQELPVEEGCTVLCLPELANRRPWLEAGTKGV